MSHGDVFRNPTRCMRAGEEPPARRNALCEPKLMWTSYPSTKPLTSDPAEVTCRACQEKLPVK